MIPALLFAQILEKLQVVYHQLLTKKKKKTYHKHLNQIFTKKMIVEDIQALQPPASRENTDRATSMQAGACQINI